MSGITVTVSPGALAAFERQAEKMSRISEAFRVHAAPLAKFAEAVRRSPRYKAQEAKKRLVAIINAHTPAQALALFTSLAQVSRTFEVWLSELLSPHEQTLVSNHGPHAPPVRSVNHGALSG